MKTVSSNRVPPSSPILLSFTHLPLGTKAVTTIALLTLSLSTIVSPFMVSSPTVANAVRAIATKTTPKAAARTALNEMGTKGEFKRTDAAWRNWISKGEFVEAVAGV